MAFINKPDPGQQNRGVDSNRITIATATTTAGVQTITDPNVDSDCEITLTPTNNAALLLQKHHGVSVVSKTSGSFGVFISATAADGGDGATFDYIVSRVP